MNYPGLLSDIDIKRLLNKDIVICGYEENNLTDIGYNLTPTEFIFSINTGSLLKIYNQNREKYCYVPANDTVLILTREAVWVSKDIAGTFHSKVKLVSNGFGHISTTLDANWEGPLLISLNNPTKKPIKLVLADDSGRRLKYNSFVTLIFYKIVTPTNNLHDNPPCRLDILQKKVKTPGFLDWNSKNYWKLYNIISKIKDFEALQVNIGQSKDQEEKNEKIKQFYRKYKEFTEKLEFNIEEAHEINRKILFKNNFVYIVVSIVLTIVFIVFVVCAIIAWSMRSSITVSLISVLIAFYTGFYNKYVFRKRRE